VIKTKNMKKYLILFSIIALASCKKYLDVNTDPNNATITKASYVFTNAEAVTAADKDGRGGTTASAQSLGSTWTGYWAHSTSFTGGGQEKTYTFTNSDFDYFNNWFDNLNDYQYVINHALGDGVGYLLGPAKIMQAFVYQKMVDVYGNVPYSEAFSPQATIFPKYDNAQTIYESLITKLTEAISDINSATWPPNEPADIIYKGDKTKWIRLANTLKLRILMRQADMPGRASYIMGAFNAISGGFITDNVYVQPTYIKTTGKMNPFYANYGFDQNDLPTGTFAYRKMNAVIVNWLKNSGDVFRMQRVITPQEQIRVTQGTTANPADYQGVPLGAQSGFLEAVCSGIGTIMINTDKSLNPGFDALRPSILMSLADAYFLQAEYQERFVGSGTAGALYAEGVKAAFRLAAATYSGTATASAATADAQAIAYMSATPGFVSVPGGPGYPSANDKIFINYSSTDTANTAARKLRAIWVQKWIALCNVDGMEAWSEYRRTNTTNAAGVVQLYGCVPYSPRSVSASTPSEPVRLFYPIREESVNSNNVPQGINVFTSKIFWDAK
jgi:hypothetical protein